MEKLNVNIARIEKDLFDLKKFGYSSTEKGIYRPGLTQPDMDARHWFLHKLRELGAEAFIDSAANVVGRWKPKKGPALVTGSHLDTVPNGGMFDGALGALAGLECIRVFKENGLDLNHTLEVLGTSEEEGRFGGMFGSQSLTGFLTADWLENAHSVDGQKLTAALEEFGLDKIGALQPRYTKGSILSFIELHIEQGPVLEQTGNTIGIVDNISGVFKWFIKFIGKADHAGTAPMDMRSDAFMGLADFAHEIRRIIDEEGSEKSRLTIGTVELKPGFAHTIPGEVDFTLVGRDVDPEVMQNLANSCRKVLSAIARKHKLMFEYEEKSWLNPQPCSQEVVQRLELVTQDLGYAYQVMPSGAGHDTQFFAKIAPSSLIFVPSVGGVSHAPDEWTHGPDIEKGANVLVNALYQIDKING